MREASTRDRDEIYLNGRMDSEETLKLNVRVADSDFPRRERYMGYSDFWRSEETCLSGDDAKTCLSGKAEESRVHMVGHGEFYRNFV